MEIILKEDVINLGYKGDILKVKDGYGRNFLIPTKKAILATESAKKMLQDSGFLKEGDKIVCVHNPQFEKDIDSYTITTETI